MKIDELLKEYKISLFVFPAELWERSGFYFPDLRRICVNESLSKQEREKSSCMKSVISTMTQNITRDYFYNMKIKLIDL